MREYNDRPFSEIVKQVKEGKGAIIYSKLSVNDFASLQYSLTRKFYYAVIVDDYPYEITDKKSLLEAMHYQARLIDVFDLNWDALADGLGGALSSFSQFEGVCLLFKRGSSLHNALQSEFDILLDIIQDINKDEDQKKIAVIFD